MNRIIAIGIVTAALAASGGATAGSARLGPATINTLAREADLVFRGRVVDIEYALSEPCEGMGGERLPHTFVTYEVDEILHGEQTGLRVTLRFVGGLDLRDFHWLAPTHVPVFDLGDEDILFVRGNGAAECPLVGNRQGRLRIIDGRLYTEGGSELLAAADGTLRPGRPFALEAFMSANVAGREFRRRIDPDDTLEDVSSSRAALADEIAARIANAAAALPVPDGFESADPALPFAGPDLTPAPRPTLAEDPPALPAIGQ